MRRRNALPCGDGSVSSRFERRRFLLAGPALLAAPLGTLAQRADKVPRIGYVAAGGSAGAFPAFVQGLRDLGYDEGQNILIEKRFAQGELERLPGFVEEVMRTNVEVLVASSDGPAAVAMKATRTLPIVTVSADPVAAGLVSNLARPGGNITGLSLAYGDAFVTKWLELLVQAVPKLAQVAVLWSAQPTPAILAELRMAAQRLKVRIDEYPVTHLAELDAALEAIASSGARGLVATASTLFTRNMDKLIQFAASKRLPAIFHSARFADAGGLMSYGPNTDAAYRRVAYFVDRILKGAKPGELPFEQPTQFEFVVNLKTARSLGLVLPQALLLRVDRVIE